MSRVSVGTLALRELAGGAGKSGDGPVEVCLRESDFQVIEVQNPNGGTMPAPANAKIQFTALSFREVVAEEPLGIWEVAVAVPTQGPDPARARVFIDGDDILYVKAFSKLV